MLCDEDQVYVYCEDAVSAVANVLNVSPWTNYDNSVLRVQGYQFEALPNGEQLRNLRRFAGSCRFVYNQALALNKQRYENKEKRLGYAGMCALLPSWKTAHPWLSDAPSQALQQSLKDLERAYTNFFNKRADFPDEKCHKTLRGARRLMAHQLAGETETAGRGLRRESTRRYRRRAARIAP